MIIVSLIVSTVVQMIFPSVYDIAPLWVAVKILLVPIICGLGYELLKFCGKYDNIITKIIKLSFYVLLLFCLQFNNIIFYSFTYSEFISVRHSQASLSLLSLFIHFDTSEELHCTNFVFVEVVGIDFFDTECCI